MAVLQTEVISIVDADPDLADLIEPSERERARLETRTQMRRLSPGMWDASASCQTDTHHRGF